MSSLDPSLLLLVPAYNEQDRIGPMLREFGAFFRACYRGKFQLLVVLNGCRDNTLQVVREVERDYPSITHLVFEDPIGKGGALIEGLKMAPLADLIGYVDADGATSPKALVQLVRQCNTGVDCVIGSRWKEESVLLQSQTWIRKIFSRGFHLVVQLLFWMNIKDTQCPAKVIRREAVEAVHPQLQLADLAFDVNLLYVLKREGFKVVEVATEWSDKVGSKVTQTLFRTSLVMFLSVLRLRLVYSPFYEWLRPLRPIETWLYGKLRAPVPLTRSDGGSGDDLP